MAVAPYLYPHSHHHSGPRSIDPATDALVPIALTIGAFVLFGLFLWAMYAVGVAQRRRLWAAFARSRGLSYSDGKIAGVIDGFTITIVPEMRGPHHARREAAVVRCEVGTDSLGSVGASDVLVVESWSSPANLNDLQEVLTEALEEARSHWHAATASGVDVAPT